METFTQSEGLGSDLVGAMARDTNGDLWVATFAGLSRLHEGKITNFTTADGLSSNVITALLPRARGTLLIGTQDRGWNLWDGQRFSRVTRDRLATTSIHAILDDGHEHLWFATGGGIARCDCAGIAGAMDGVDCLNWIEFSHRRRPDRPRDGDQQPSFRVAGEGRAPVVRHAQGTGVGGSGAFPGEPRAAAGRDRALCGGRLDQALLRPGFARRCRPGTIISSSTTQG